MTSKYSSKYSKVSLIKPHDEITNKLKMDDIEKYIISEVTKLLPMYKGLTDIKLIKLIGTYIENMIKKHYGADKLAIFISIIKILFPNLTCEELQLSIRTLEECLLDKLIKKIPVLRYAYHLTHEFIKDSTKSFFFTKL
jgi:hypothetical protein